MSIELPPLVSSRLAEDRALHAEVLLTIENFGPVVERGHLTFFPEYTDHGPRHASSVLNSMAALADESAWAVLTAEDAALLTLSALLHDIALYLTEDGLASLIRDRDGWQARWADFLFEARHWSESTLNDVLGSNEPPPIPNPAAGGFSLRERLLIGEFIRRWHGELAELVCVSGMPGPGEATLATSVSSVDLSRLLGFVARSHTMELRYALGVLEHSFDLREFRGAHPVILMVLLRVADYLEISADRAPGQVLTVSRLRSPISAREWSAHAAVREIRSVLQDPEAIYVEVGPTNLDELEKLREWVDGIPIRAGSVLGRTRRSIRSFR